MEGKAPGVEHHQRIGIGADAGARRRPLRGRELEVPGMDAQRD